MIAYEVSMINLNMAFIIQPEEVAKVRWLGKGQWQRRYLFPVYQCTLEVYFSNL